MRRLLMVSLVLAGCAHAPVVRDDRPASAVLCDRYFPSAVMTFTQGKDVVWCLGKGQGAKLVCTPDCAGAAERLRRGKKVYFKESTTGGRVL